MHTAPEYYSISDTLLYLIIRALKGNPVDMVELETPKPPFFARTEELLYEQLMLLRGGGAGGKININGIGRNFSYPTQFNQQHTYNSVEEYINAHLFPPLPPVATILGQFRLNGSAAFTNFTTIERGTIINEVKITASATAQPNSPAIKELAITGGALPALYTFDPALLATGDVVSTEGAIALNAVKTYTAKAKDETDIYSSNASTGWGIGVKAYFGAGIAEGAAIDEAFIRSLSKHANFNQHMAAVTVTPAADQYIYYAAPVSWGLRVFEFLGSDQTNPEAALRIKVRTDSEVANGIAQADATEYFVVRSLGKGLGGGAPYTFQIGTIG